MRKLSSQCCPGSFETGPWIPEGSSGSLCIEKRVEIGGIGVCVCVCECEKKVECGGKEERTLVRRYDKERVLALTPIPILLRVCWKSATKLGRGGDGD